jgi:serine protease Do
MKDLPRVVADTEIGKTVTIKLIRKGETLTVSATVGRLEDGEKIVVAQGGGAITTLGMTVSPLTDELRERYKIDKDVEGAVVTAVDAAGPAAEKRIEPGDVITEAGEKDVASPADIQARVKDAETEKRNSVLLLISKGGKQGEMRFVAVKLKKN